MLFLRREQGRLDELVEAVEGFADRYPDVPAWRCALAYAYAELDRRLDARRELDVLARTDFSDLPRDWLWLVSITHLSEVVAYLDDPAGPNCCTTCSSPTRIAAWSSTRRSARAPPHDRSACSRRRWDATTRQRGTSRTRSP